jgi:hypothetical protein
VSVIGSTVDRGVLFLKTLQDAQKRPTSLMGPGACIEENYTDCSAEKQISIQSKTHFNLGVTDAH